MRGNDVLELQALLNYHLSGSPPPLATDGVFGALTDARVRDFQETNAIQIDGVVGPETRSVLYATIKVKIYTTVALGEGRSIFVARAGGFRSGVLLASAGSTLPIADVPSAQTAPPSLHLDNIQVQAGGQRTFSPWLGPSSPGFNSLVLTAQATFLKVGDGPHLELTPGVQVAANGAPSDSKYNVQVFFQVTAADLIAPGRFHLFSPFAQATFQSNFAPFGAPTAGLTVGDTLQFDIIKDRWMFFVQGALATNIDLNTGAVSVSPQILTGMSIQANF
jgi:hypothetical protein